MAEGVSECCHGYCYTFLGLIGEQVINQGHGGYFEGFTGDYQLHDIIESWF